MLKDSYHVADNELVHQTLYMLKDIDSKLNSFVKETPALPNIVMLNIKEDYYEIRHMIDMIYSLQNSMWFWADTTRTAIKEFEKRKKIATARAKKGI